jgi:hypothetical protein
MGDEREGDRGDEHKGRGEGMSGEGGGVLMVVDMGKSTCI